MNRPAFDRAAATKRDDQYGELRPGHSYLPATIDESDPETGDGRLKRPRNEITLTTNCPPLNRAAGAFSRSHKFVLATLTLVLTFVAIVGTSPRSASADEPANFALFEANASGEGIGWRNAYLLSLLDYYVYDGVIPDATGAEFAAKFEEFFAPLGLSNFTYIDTGWWNTDTQAMIVETDNAIIVAFRGTQGFWDLATDSDLGVGTPEGIHKGFSLAARAALPEVKAAIAAAPGKTIWLTGHSLGGAVAQATAYYLALERIFDASVPPVQGIVTFGSPRVFRTIGTAGPIYWANYGDFKSERWVNNNDPVPHTPWPIEFYHQSKWTRIVVAGNGACSLEVREIVAAWPDFADHDVPRYASRIYSMMPEGLRPGLPLPPLPAEPVANCDQLPGVSRPLIDSNTLDNTVHEGAANGTPVGLTVAPSTSDVGSLTYSLFINAGGRFAIDASSGVVTVADGSLLDFETATAHTIFVLASGSDGTQAGVFAINVTDIPSAPVDTDAAGDQVSEGAAAGTAVGITASSIGESGSTVAYSLADSAGGRFAIDASSGVVTVGTGALLDGPETHFVRVVANHSGASSYAQTFAVAVVNANPAATITALDGGVPDVGFLGVPVSFGGSFSDAALDTHTARLDWGDGSAVSTFGGGNVTSPVAATHTYQATGSYTVSFTVQDDDGGTDTVTRAITVHDGVGGVGAVVAILEGLVESETDPQVLKALAQALVELEGNGGGASGNGAVDAIADGDLVAALGKIEDAVALLSRADAVGADTSDLRLMLALAARITAEKAQADAIAAIGPSPSRGEERQLSSIAASVEAGRAATGSGDYVAAIEDFTSAVQRALALIG